MILNLDTRCNHDSRRSHPSPCILPAQTADMPVSPHHRACIRLRPLKRAEAHTCIALRCHCAATVYLFSPPAQQPTLTSARAGVQHPYEDDALCIRWRAHPHTGRGRLGLASCGLSVALWQARPFFCFADHQYTVCNWISKVLPWLNHISRPKCCAVSRRS